MPPASFLTVLKCCLICSAASDACAGALLSFSMLSAVAIIASAADALPISFMVCVRCNSVQVLYHPSSVIHAFLLLFSPHSLSGTYASAQVCAMRISLVPDGV